MYKHHYYGFTACQESQVHSDMLVQIEARDILPYCSQFVDALPRRLFDENKYPGERKIYSDWCSTKNIKF